MSWRGARVRRELEAFLSLRVQRAIKYLQGYIKLNIGANVGSVVPFVASKPGEWPYKWDGVLYDSIETEMETRLLGWVVSDAVDEHVHPGHHFSAEEEYGHFWDGWAWDFQTNRIVKVAEPHWVEARPFMRRGLEECKEAIFTILTASHVSGVGRAA